MSAKPVPQEVFLSYASEDEPLCLELEKHLSLLKREGLITTWHKGQIGVGNDMDEEIGARLSTASIIVLLLSAGFVASNACYSVEMSRAMERHEVGEAFVIPVVLRPMDSWQNTSFGSLQALPRNGVPVTNWSDAHAAFADVAQGIRSVVQDGTLPPRVAHVSPAPIWNIPYPRNPFFTGRDELLTRLSTALKTNQATALSQAQAISGLGGIGKTQIAVEYAYQHVREYAAVLWTLSDTRESLISGYITIAELLNLPQKDEQDQGVIVQAVKSWLQTHGSWLLILDNADELAVVREFVPAVSGGHILLTTRTQATGKLAHRIEVETMPQDVGALFLLRRACLVRSDAMLADADPSDIVTARSITEELGGLPLALDQAGAYIENSQCSLSDYRQRYQMRRSLLLRQRGDLVEDHPEPVATTWSLSFEKVEYLCPAAGDLLRVCAFLAPDAIPEEIITKGATHLGVLLKPMASDPFLLDEAVGALLAYSLLRRDASTRTLSVHRLVQAVVRDGMSVEGAKQWMERVVRALDETFPLVSFEKWTRCGRLLPHVLLCVPWIEQEPIPKSAAAHLLLKTGVYLLERGQYSEAEILLVRAHSIREQHFGVEHPATASCLSNLAGLYWRQGKYEQAEPLFQRALSIREQCLGTDHPSTARCLNGLATTYRYQGKYKQAEPLYRRALAICEQRLGVNHHRTALSLDNLAILYIQQGKYQEAEPLLQRALSIQEQCLGAEHPDTALSLNNLALLYQQQGKYEQAKPLYLQALSIREQHLGTEHPDTATSLNNLAEFYQHQGKYEQAELLYQRALAIREQRLGPTHPETQETCKAYTAFLRLVGRDDEATTLETQGQLPSEEH